MTSSSKKGENRPATSTSQQPPATEGAPVEQKPLPKMEEHETDSDDDYKEIDIKT